MVIHRAQANQIPADTQLVWGLSRRLPRWNAFDGRRSQVAPTWARFTRASELPSAAPMSSRRPWGPPAADTLSNSRT